MYQQKTKFFSHFIHLLEIFTNENKFKRKYLWTARVHLAVNMVNVIWLFDWNEKKKKNSLTCPFAIKLVNFAEVIHWFRLVSLTDNNFIRIRKEV